MSAQEAVQGKSPANGQDELLIYQDEDFAWELAHELQPYMNRALEMRELYRTVSQREPDGTFMTVRETLGDFFGLTKYVTQWNVSKPILTNQTMANAFKEEITAIVGEINEISESAEHEYEAEHIDRLVDDPTQWTNEQTKEHTGMTLSKWKRLGRDGKLWKLIDYARTHDHVRGIRSTTLGENALPPSRHNELTKNPPFMALEQFLGESAVEAPITLG